MNSSFFLERIGTADRIVIIGWSLPDTDNDHREAIKQRILHRDKQIEALVIIDKGGAEKDKYFDRMEALFQPKIMKRCREGFSKESIQKYICANLGRPR